MQFKIGQRVKYESPEGAILFGRIEAQVAPNRYQLLVVPGGLRLVVPGGDIALPGEDAAREAREASARAWAAGAGTSNQSGGYRTSAFDAQAVEQGDADEGRH